MQLRDLYTEVKNRFKQTGFETPHLDAASLVANSLGLNRLDIYTKPHHEVDSLTIKTFEKKIERRLAGEPVSYITGFKEFYSIRFKVNNSVLIPRPETEILVEEALNLIPENERCKLADVGTGSGCIGITISKSKPNVEVVASDIFFSAMKTANENSTLNGVSEKLSLVCADLLEAFKEESFDIIVSNPPYVSSSEYETLEIGIKDYEPRLALVGGEDGLDLIRKIVFYSKRVLKPGGWCLIEVGLEQSSDVKKIFEEGGFTNVSTACDLNGIERVLKARWKK